MADNVYGGTTITNTSNTVSTKASGVYPGTGATSYGNLMFPSDLINDSADRNFYMTFQFEKYERRSIFDRAQYVATSGIRLPIPNNLVDTQSVVYGEEQSNLAGAAIEGALHARAQNGMVDKAMSTAGGIAASALQAVGAGGSNLAQRVGFGAGTISQVPQLFGVAQNPFLTVLFKSPAYKEHSFSWKFSPSTMEESNALRDIIKTFRANQLPGVAGSTGGSLLTYPNIVHITLYPKDEYLYKFKPCVIESLSFNYASGGMPAFFKKTKAPVEVQMTMRLKEIEYWLQEDITNGGQLSSTDTVVGSAGWLDQALGSIGVGR